jgi:hypothetical protein
MLAGRNKPFAERLNRCLDDLGVPSNLSNRSAILSKMIHIPRQEARMLVEGYSIPNEYLLQRLTDEFEVESGWLLGHK